MDQSVISAPVHGLALWQMLIGQLMRMIDKESLVTAFISLTLLFPGHPSSRKPFLSLLQS